MSSKRNEDTKLEIASYSAGDRLWRELLKGVKINPADRSQRIMKLISPDQTFIYYIRDRADGKSHGIRIGQSTGACGFVSNTPTAQQTHPVRFTQFDSPTAQVPIMGNSMPPILTNVVGELEDEYPEIHDILSGAVTFEQALQL